MTKGEYKQLTKLLKIVHYDAKKSLGEGHWYVGEIEHFLETVGMLKTLVESGE